MKTNNILFLIFTLLMISCLVESGMAQEKTTEFTMPQIAGSADMTDGEIRKIDMDNKKITIKHSEIKNLDMPGMTMVFQVKDPAFLENVRKGDKVKFRVEKSGTAFVITEIHVIK